MLPEATDESIRLTEICTHRFHGDPAYISEIVDDDPGLSQSELEQKRIEILDKLSDQIRGLTLESPTVNKEQIEQCYKVIYNVWVQ